MAPHGIRHALRSLDALAEKRTGTLTNHADILATIEASGTGLSVREIADAMALSPSTVRRYVNDLRDAGYLGEGATFSGATAYFRTDAKDPSA